MKTIAVLGTFDTKGVEHTCVAEQIRQRGHKTLLIDAGGLGEPQCAADVTPSEVAKAGGHDLAELKKRNDRGAMIEAMSNGAAKLVAELVKQNRIQGIISLGGTGGTAIGTAAMRALPLGFPKVMVSTVASGNIAPYVAAKDVLMFPSIVDVAGLNRFSRMVFARAAATVCAWLDTNSAMSVETDTKPLIVASMFGNTTRGVEHARKWLEAEGFEVLVFHATGTGGRTMEALIESGMVAGVLDITTTEWADELVGGVLNAGPTRLEAAARNGVPAIVTPGCLDMVNFGPPESVPAKFKGRTFYQHNPQVTLMRTTPDECAQLGKIVADKINLSTGPVTVLIPKKGVSVISMAGQSFHDPAADNALFSALKQNVSNKIPVLEFDHDVNSPEFAEACANELIANIKRKKK